MLNWPGANGRKCGSASGASVSVKVSPVSLVMWRTSKGSGRIGSAPWGAIGGASIDVAIEIQELYAHGLQPRDDEDCETLQHLVAEGGVLLALRAQAGPVDRKRTHHVHGARVEGCLVGRENPGPAQHLAHVRRLD